MQTNDLMKVTRMSVYFGEYKQARKNGQTTWAKVVLHVSPVVTDPLDGTKYVNLAIDLVIIYWVSDLAVDELHAVATEKGTKFVDKEKSQGYIIDEANVPRAYRYAFTDMGMTLHWERVEFPTKRFKVDAKGKIVKSDNKPVSASGVTVTYWTGGLADNSGTNLSREYCMKHTLAEWKEVVLPTLEKEEKPAEDQHEGEESTGA